VTGTYIHFINKSITTNIHDNSKTRNAHKNNIILEKKHMNAFLNAILFFNTIGSESCQKEMLLLL